ERIRALKPLNHRRRKNPSPVPKGRGRIVGSLSAMDGSRGGYISLILHGHLPFVRHPEHEKFLEESWLFEAILESYIPLLQVLEGWEEDGLKAAVTVTLTPTLCSMLADPLLQQRHMWRFAELVELADKELHRTQGKGPLHELAQFYCKRFEGIRDYYCRR